MQRKLYTQPYAAFVPYEVYKGHLDDAAVVAEAWLRKKKRTSAAMGAMWRIAEFRCKSLGGGFSVIRDVQWDAPTKIRVALWTPEDAALFIVKVAPQRLSAGFSPYERAFGDLN